MHAPSILPVRHTFSNPSPVIICPTNPSWCLFITFIGSLSDPIYSKTCWFVVCDTWYMQQCPSLQGAERATWRALSESAELTTLSKCRCLLCRRRVDHLYHSVSVNQSNTTRRHPEPRPTTVQLFTNLLGKHDNTAGADVCRAD